MEREETETEKNNQILAVKSILFRVLQQYSKSVYPILSHELFPEP
jgi:hypothetical protein